MIPKWIKTSNLNKIYKIYKTKYKLDCKFVLYLGKIPLTAFIQLFSLKEIVNSYKIFISAVK